MLLNLMNLLFIWWDRKEACYFGPPTVNSPDNIRSLISYSYFDTFCDLSSVISSGDPFSFEEACVTVEYDKDPVRRSGIHNTNIVSAHMISGR